MRVVDEVATHRFDILQQYGLSARLQYDGGGVEEVLGRQQKGLAARRAGDEQLGLLLAYHYRLCTRTLGKTHGFIF